MLSEVGGLAIAAHELKSPLAAMRQLALSMDFAEDSRLELERTRDELVTISERALRQVCDLTKVARLEDGLFSMEPVSVRHICDHVLTELRPYFASNQRNLQAVYKSRTDLVIANPDLLFSIIYNFCTNAVHYSTPETESKLSISDCGEMVEVAVRDFGPALPTKIWQEIRDGLNQPTNISMRPGSSGLGLYIASKFSKYMQAEMLAVRHRDGTSFKIRIPASRQVSFSF